MTLTVLLVLNISAWILFILVFRMVLRRTVRPKRILAEIESELDSLLTEMNGSTERNIRLMEESVRRLKEEVRQADKRIKILKGENEKRTESVQEYSHLAGRKPISIQVVEDEPQVRTPPEPPEDETGQHDPESVKNTIIDLNRKGLAPGLIAGKVGRPLGEVELIISLSKKSDR